MTHILVEHEAPLKSSCFSQIAVFLWNFLEKKFKNPTQQVKELLERDISYKRF